MNSSELQPPETQSSLNDTLQFILRGVRQNLPDAMKGAISDTGSDISITTTGGELLTITPDSLLLFGATDIESLLKQDGAKSYFENDHFIKFLSLTRSALIRLNHVGVSYPVDDLEQAKADVMQMAQKHGMKTYLEDSGESDEIWQFVGNADKWEEPMMEFVLKERGKTDGWTPHFQIDMDFDLSPDNLEALADEAFGNGFAKWKLDIPDIGVVLMMGKLGEANGTILALGLGTNLRDPKIHRQEVLKEI